jgi:hypothetical protein
VAECILLETISPPSHSTIHFIGAFINNNTGDVLGYHHLMKIDKHKKVWANGFTNEIGQLFQGIRNVPGTDTCFFIPKSLIPAHKRPTYERICRNYQPQKEEEHCVRLTVGGNWIDYPGNKSTPTANLTTAKLLIHSTISTPGAKFLGINLANFYLNTPMLNPKYMHLHLDIIPDKIINYYNLCDIVTPDGWVYIKIWKGMYGLPQAGSSQINYSKNALPSKGITNANIHLVSGATFGKTSCSAWWLTIVASRSPTCTTWTTLSMY